MSNTRLELFWSKVDKSAAAPCWGWAAAKSHGYGCFWNGTGPVAAHRFAYELIKGEIPSGLFLDHLCENPPCVNPDHLEPVTNAENLRRSEKTLAGSHMRRAYCPAGHVYDEKNTRIVNKANGLQARACRACNRERMARTRAGGVVVDSDRDSGTPDNVRLLDHQNAQRRQGGRCSSS